MGILGELNLVEGGAMVHKSTLYCPQTPALLTGSIISNITWGLPYDATIFQQVVSGCCLLPDFQQFVNAEETIIGEAGVKCVSSLLF